MLGDIKEREIQLVSRIWQEFEDFVEGRSFFISRFNNFCSEFKLKWGRIKANIDKQLPIGSPERELWDLAPKMNKKEADLIVEEILRLYDSISPKMSRRVYFYNAIARRLATSEYKVRLVWDNCLSEAQKEKWREIFKLKPQVQTPKALKSLTPRLERLKCYLEEKKTLFINGWIASLPTYTDIAVEISGNPSKPISRERVRQLMIKTIGYDGVAEWQSLRQQERIVPEEIKKIVAQFVENQYALFWQSGINEIYNNEILGQLFGLSKEEAESVLGERVSSEILCNYNFLLRIKIPLTVVRNIILAIHEEMRKFKAGEAKKVRCPQEIRRQFNVSYTEVYRLGERFLTPNLWDFYLSLPKRRIIANPSQKRRKGKSYLKFYHKITQIIRELLADFKNGLIGQLPDFDEISGMVGQECTAKIVKKFFGLRSKNPNTQAQKEEYLLYLSTNKPTPVPLKRSLEQIIPPTLIPVAIPITSVSVSA